MNEVMHDTQTLAFYDREAQKYADRSGGTYSHDLTRFLAPLPPGACILELGCGSGCDTAAMLACGFDVTPTDGSPQMAAEASLRLGRAVRQLLFEELDETNCYNGVWANACLLHVPFSNLPGVLTLVHRALRAGGWFYANYKAGNGEGRDQFGRYYSYPTEADLTAAYVSAADWHSIRLERQNGSGYDGQPTAWLAVLAQS